MKLKCIIASGSALAAVITGSPEQARKRVGLLTGATAHVVHVELPENGMSSADHLKRSLASFGIITCLTTDHLGSVWLTHAANAEAITPDRVREVVRAERDAMREETRRAIEIGRLRRRLNALGANDDTIAVRAA